jgi:hypothetical protein
METVDEETQYWQMRIDQDDDDGAVAMPAPQPVPVRDAGEPTIIQFSGAAVRVTFHAVPAGDDYLREDWRGAHMRGPKLKSSFSFSDAISLKDITVSDVQSLAEHILKKRLDLTASQLVGSRIKLTEVGNMQLSDAVQYKYVDLSAPASVVYEESIQCPKQITFYVPEQLLQSARVDWALVRYGIFLERAAMATGTSVSANQMAALIGHGSHTIKHALGPRSPMGGSTLADIESTMRAHFADGFASFAVALEAALIKKGKRQGKRAATAQRPSLCPCIGP